MSVYTPLTKDEMRQVVAAYPVGKLLSYHGITGGLTNTNYWLHVEKGVFILTLFESLSHEELFYYVSLMDFLSRSGFPAPSPILQKNGYALAQIKNKPALLVSFLEGEEIDSSDENTCYEVGKTLAYLHQVGQDFPLKKENERYRFWWQQTSERLLPVLAKEQKILLQHELQFLQQSMREDLPRGLIHSDLFRDNVLIKRGKVTGFIDFYYASDGILVYDLAIALNDWTLGDNFLPQESKEKAFLQGYETIRPLHPNEKNYLPIARRAAAIRFWVSRLQDLHFPLEGEKVLRKDPRSFENLLRYFTD